MELPDIRNSVDLRFLHPGSDLLHSVNSFVLLRAISRIS